MNGPELLAKVRAAAEKRFADAGVHVSETVKPKLIDWTVRDVECRIDAAQGQDVSLRRLALDSEQSSLLITERNWLALQQRDMIFDVLFAVLAAIP